MARNPDDGQKDCLKTCRVVIPIKVELGASVGFIHKESLIGYLYHSQIHIHNINICKKNLQSFGIKNVKFCMICYIQNKKSRNSPFNFVIFFHVCT
jgi:hypothetical protein